MPWMREDESALDTWTFIHALSGVMFGLAGLPLWVVILVTVGWEILENSSIGIAGFDYAGWPKFTGESLPNVVVDLVASTLGWFVIVAFGAGGILVGVLA